MSLSFLTGSSAAAGLASGVRSGARHIFLDMFISQLHIRLIIFVYPNIVKKNATNVTGEVYLNHHLQYATEIPKMEQIVKCFCFYQL